MRRNGFQNAGALRFHQKYLTQMDPVTMNEHLAQSIGIRCRTVDAAVEFNYYYNAFHRALDIIRPDMSVRGSSYGKMCGLLGCNT